MNDLEQVTKPQPDARLARLSRQDNVDARVVVLERKRVDDSRKYAALLLRNDNPTWDVVASSSIPVKDALYTAGYTEQPYTRTTIGKDGSMVTEDRIAFIKQTDNGDVQYLEDQRGNALTLNKGLYEARVQSKYHFPTEETTSGHGSGGDVTYTAIVGVNGEIMGRMKIDSRPLLDIDIPIVENP